MRPGGTRFLAVLLAALVVPVATAAPDPPVSTGASTAGGFAVEGDLAALRYLSSLASDEEFGLDLHLEAASLLLEEETRGGVHVQDKGALARARVQRQSWSLENVTVQEVEARPDRDLTVLPIDARVEATGAVASWLPPLRTVVRAVDRVEFADRDTSVSVVDTVQMDGAAAITVTGDFVVLLWDMDLSVEDADGRRTHSSGHTSELGTAPYNGQVGTVTGPSNGNITELVLEVHDGVLRLGPGDGRRWLHLRDSAIHLSSVRLDDVSGTLPPSVGGGPVEDATLDLRGDLFLGLQAAGDVLAWSLDGRVDAASLDGRPYAVVAPLAGGPATRSLLPWMTALAILGAGGLPLHRVRASRRLEDAELLLAAGHFQAAAEVARPLPWSGVRGQAAALRAQALLHVGAEDEARRLARTAARRDRVLAGLIHATLEDWDGGDA